ncbi:MAG: hypothetical protein NTZ02_02410 [Candidatus Woesearchaeota archaeon]|nr:hypothetical protein [Candidatus Woesearchaeota archaeon]
MILESGNIYKYDFTPSQKKNYSIRVYARDSAGNQNNSASYGFAASVKKTEIGASFQNDTPLVRDYTNQTSTALDIAVNSSVTGNITVALFSDTPAFANTTLSNGIKFVDINLSDNVGDVLRWILIKVYYTDAEISGLDESTLKLSWYNQSSGTWVTMSAGSPSWVNSTGVDTVNNYVWANVSHLSLYGINGSTAAAPPTPPPEEEGVTTTISPNVIYLNGTQQILQMTSAYKVQTHVGNLLYEITIQNFSQGKNVTFKISSASGASYVTVNKGETKILDLNADGQADLSIKAIDIASYYANVLFEKLAATPPAAPSANVTNNTGTPGPATPGVTPPATPPKPKVTITAQLLIFAISSTAVIILLAALIILEYRKKRKLTA